MSAYVYRHFDDAGNLLYVGCTNNVEHRTREHAQQSPWFLTGTRVESTPFPDIDSALAAETAAIEDEHPRWNVVGRSSAHPDGPARAWYNVAVIHPGTFRARTGQWDFEKARAWDAIATQATATLTELSHRLGLATPQGARYYMRSAS